MHHTNIYEMMEHLTKNKDKNDVLFSDDGKNQINAKWESIKDRQFKITNDYEILNTEYKFIRRIFKNTARYTEQESWEFDEYAIFTYKKLDEFDNIVKKLGIKNILKEVKSRMYNSCFIISIIDLKQF